MRKSTRKSKSDQDNCEKISLSQTDGQDIHEKEISDIKENIEDDDTETALQLEATPLDSAENPKTETINKSDD